MGAGKLQESNGGTYDKRIVLGSASGGPVVVRPSCIYIDWGDKSPAQLVAVNSRKVLVASSQPPL